MQKDNSSLQGDAAETQAIHISPKRRGFLNPEVSATARNTQSVANGKITGDPEKLLTFENS